MSIAQLQPSNQAPSGAACVSMPQRRSDMPLLTELEKVLVGPCHYKHAAPDGAIGRGRGYEILRLGAWTRLLLTPDALHFGNPGVGIEFGHSEKHGAGLFDRCGLTSKMQLGDSQGLG
jgi:hypothetical protein